MTFCERISGEAEQIKEMICEDREQKVEAEKVERDLEFSQENVISKDEQIYNLKLYIEEIAINFREENYKRVDELFSKVGL